ncbi:MAG TPA: DUF6600 domain-containing protein [Pyrinomonadaceae bacterium]|nr:DUF6600 domain-containing protein [Pyrinomonadaceae bacterium]
MKNLKVWPHLTIVAIVCALAAGIGVALWMRNEQKATAEALPPAARIQRVDGQVALMNSLDPNVANNSNGNEWIAATANQPFSVGDRLYTRDNSQASLAFNGRNYARLYPNTALDVVSLGNDRTQLALREGSAIFDVGYLPSGELFEVGTPYGAVDFYEPGLYDVRLDNGAAIISVLSGLAQVVGMGGSGEISKGEVLRLVGQTAANVVLSQIDGRDAGYLVDDYYRYQYPNYYDGRYNDYNAYLNDPFYFDPYRRSPSYRYVSNYIPGFYDLDYYGDWMDVSGYGHCWSPRVASGWSPYQNGYWYSDYPYGLTWVSTEPWGYAPYHYGRWAFMGDRWYWVPDSVNTSPLYSPALVAFTSFNDANLIGWLPLGPGDDYPYRYYDNNWQPYYLTDVVQPRFVNLQVPGAVTVVTVDQFGRVIDPSIIRTVDVQTVAQVRPELEPLLLTPLRNAAVNSAWGRGKIDIPPGIARKLVETPVVISTAPAAPPFRKDLARVMRVEQAPERAKNQKLNVKDERRHDRAAEVPRGQQTEVPLGVADQQRELRGRGQQQIERQQQRELRRLERTAPRQAQGERVANPARETPRAARPQEGPQPRIRVERSRPDRQVRPQPKAAERPQPMRRVQPQPQPRAVERPRPVHPVQSQQRVERPQVVRQQPEPRAAERPRPVQQQQRVERPQQMRQQPPPRAVEQRSAPVQRQQQQERKAERQQGPPAAKVESQGGGKGKGRKP